MQNNKFSAQKDSHFSSQEEIYHNATIAYYRYSDYSNSVSMVGHDLKLLAFLFFHTAKHASPVKVFASKETAIIVLVTK